MFGQQPHVASGVAECTSASPQHQPNQENKTPQNCREIQRKKGDTRMASVRSMTYIARVTRYEIILSANSRR